ncbi:MAG: hypothetical protein HUU57_04180 [Bdellovibrio sp.]|nr:hypothetical protein [Bdellovibrio sp.]
MITALLFSFFTHLASAQQLELLDRNFSGSSSAKTPQEAKKDIQDQASRKISEDIIKELIGEDRYAKNKALVTTKIIRNAARFIPFSKPSALLQEGEIYKMSVAVKVSLRDLKQMLQENSLLNENDSVPVVLPVISWVDRVQGRSFRWWLPLDRSQQGFLVKEGRFLEDALRSAFQKNNFYVVKPVDANLGANVPVDFQTEKVSSGEDAQFFAHYFNAPVLIDGQVLLNKGERRNFRIEIRMTAIQVSNGRAIADVSRRFETESGSFESAVDKKLREVIESTANDLASQVLEAWQRGSIGTSVIRLTLKGKSTLPMMEGFKDKVRSQITQVKNIRERLVSADSISYEVDTSAAVADLMAKLEALDIDGRKLSKVSEGSDEIVLKWAN